jgi:hypothetical protein
MSVPDGHRETHQFSCQRDFQVAVRAGLAVSIYVSMCKHMSASETLLFSSQRKLDVAVRAGVGAFLSLLNVVTWLFS